ncbi:MAG: hypothetical protein ACI8RD_006853, partial [Bacillariaceae sp.]|jgi:hypothetical protein
VLPLDPILEGEDQIDAGGTRYKKLKKEEWTHVQEGEGRLIEPIEWTGDDEEFSVNITDEEVNQLRNASGEIRYDMRRSFGVCQDMGTMMDKLYLSFKRQE